MPSLMTNRFVRRRTLLSVWPACLLVTCVLCYSFVPSVRASAPAGFRVADPGKKAFGQTYGQWASDWWEWALQFPIVDGEDNITNPLFDETGGSCDLGDQGSVWFLAGNFGGTTVRECSAPAGKAFFFPVFNVISFAPEFGDTVEEIRADANGDIEGADPIISCIIDDVPVDDVFAFRAQTPPGGFTLSNLDLFVELIPDFDPEPRFPAISDGYWLMVKGLSPGEHVIQILASAPLFELDVTYILTLGG